GARLTFFPWRTLVRSPEKDTPRCRAPARKILRRADGVSSSLSPMPAGCRRDAGGTPRVPGIALRALLRALEIAARIGVRLTTATPRPLLLPVRRGGRASPP